MAFGHKNMRRGPYEERMRTDKLNILTAPALTTNHGPKDTLKGTYWIDSSGNFKYYDANEVEQTLATGAGGGASLDACAAIGAVISDLGATVEISDSANTNTLLTLDSDASTDPIFVIEQANGIAGDLIYASYNANEVFAFEDGGKLQFTANADTVCIDLPDGKGLELGTSADMVLSYVGATDTLTITPRADNLTLSIGTSTACLDTKLWGDGDAYVLWDGSAELLLFEGTTQTLTAKFNDTDKIEFGDGASATGSAGDANLAFDASNLVLSATSDDTISFVIGSSTVAMDTLWYAAGTSESALFDAGNAQLTLTNLDLHVATDDNRIEIGTAGGTTDGYIKFSGTELEIDVGTGGTGVAIGKDADTNFIMNGAGSSTVTWDYGLATLVLNACDLYLGDDDLVGFGDGGGAGDPDVQAEWDTTTTKLLLTGKAADTEICIGHATANTFDVRFLAVGTAASPTAYSLYDASELAWMNEGSDIKLNDADVLNLGDGASATAVTGDVQIYHDGTSSLNIVQGTGGAFATLKLGSAATDTDVVWYANGSGTFTFDSTNKTFVSSGADIHLIDTDILVMGTTGGTTDFYQSFNATNLLMDIGSGGTGIVVGSQADTDFTLTGATTGASMAYNAGLHTLFVEGGASDTGYVKIHDSDILAFGDGASAAASIGDATLSYASGDLKLDTGASGTFTSFTISDSSDDVDVIWAAKTSGTITFDSTNKYLAFSGTDITMLDGDILIMGTTGGTTDAYMAFDGTNLNIDVGAAGGATTPGIVIGATGDTDFALTGAGAGSFANWDKGLVTLFVEGGGADIGYIKLNDSDVLGFGDGASGTASVGDVELIYTAAGSGTFTIDKGTGGALATVVIGSAATDTDFQWNATSSGSVLFDSTNKQVSITGDLALLADDNALEFGTGGGTTDAYIKFSGTELEIDVGSGGTGVVIGRDVDTDFVMNGTAVGGGITWDWALETLFVEGGTTDIGYIKLHDADVLGFGDGASAAASIADVELVYDGTNKFTINTGSGGTLTTIALGGAATDVDVVWYAASSGSVTFDSTNKQVTIVGDLALATDDNALEFGTGGGTTDAYMKFSGTELEIDVGAGGTGVNIGKDADTDFTCTTAAGSVVVDHGANTMTAAGVHVVKGGTAIARGAGNAIEGSTITVLFDMDNTAGSATWTNSTGLACMVVGATFIKTDAVSGGAGDTVQLLNGGNAISDALAMNCADATIKPFVTFDDAYMSIAGAGTLVCTTVKGTDHCECYVAVQLMPIAA